MNPDIKCASVDGLLTLLAIRGVGPRAAEQLATRFATLGDVRNASPQQLSTSVSNLAIDETWGDRTWETAYSRMRRIIEEAQQQSVRVLAASDQGYPAWLREIRDRPPVIYVKGTIPVGRRFVACIGTREPSQFGDQVTRRIALLLAENGWSIVSGLAIGVDTLAHKAALEANGHTVAVLANGLESVYPKRNTSLAAQILDSGGAWLSERPFGTPPIPHHLVRRDRLQSGMSAGTIVMQTGFRGGSMHTVRFTLLQGRKLFAPVPCGRHAEDEKSKGILALTQRRGAELGNLLEAQGKYRRLLEEVYRDEPPAIPLNGRRDYGTLLANLDDALTVESEHGGDPAGSQPSLF
ncbi:MAG: DNA-protecting protein DprA [bacterium]|nr:DNA-protecting protein DprA [bacterium]